jgi:mono/diheme cytochrome c family protein
MVGAVVCTAVGIASAQSPDHGKKEQSEGEEVYMQARCFACHGGYGFGAAGPRFRQNRMIGLGDYVVGQILIGRGIMPSFADSLSDQQIAAVATYIRTSWGNEFEAVKPSDVAHVRQQVKLRPPDQPHLPPSFDAKDAK